MENLLSFVLFTFYTLSTQKYYYITTLHFEDNGRAVAGIMELRKLSFALLRQTTRQRVNETTSGAVAGNMELRKLSFALLRQTTRQRVNETTSGAVAGLLSCRLVVCEAGSKLIARSSKLLRLRSASEAQGGSHL